MKKTLICLLALTMLLSVFGTVSATAEELPLPTEKSPTWVSSLGKDLKAKQLFVVAGIGKTTAYVSMHQKDDKGVWRQIISTPGYIGKNGLGKTMEGDGMTPVGNFTFNRAFGIAEDPGCALEYLQVDDSHYWSGDEREGYAYNELVSIEDLPDLNTEVSEHIIDYTSQYQYCLNISYNEEGVPGVGSAIFLHCLGPVKPYTGGCVAIPKDQMVTVMKYVSPDCVVVIDSLKNISATTWESFGLESEEEPAEGPADEPEIDYGASNLYSKADMDSAIAGICEEFAGWEGCALHSVRYAGDDCADRKNLDWMNSLREEKTFTSCIAFKSDFHSPVEDGSYAWETDAEYTDWEWWLARPDGGDWELVTWGY